MINTTKLDPIETASIDELQALQTARLKWTLNHAYNNVPMYKRKFDAAGVHPDDFNELADLQNSRAPPSRICATTTRSIPLRCRWSRWCASTPRRAPPESRPWWDIPRMISTTGPISSPGAAGAARRIKFTWPTATGYSPAGWGALRCRASGCDGDPDVRRPDGEAGAADPRFSAGYDHGDALILPEFNEELERQMGGDASACSLRVGVFGAEPWTQAMRREIENGWALPRWISMVSPK